MSTTVWPTKLSFQKTSQQLVIAFDDGTSGAIGYKFLRENSPSAEVQGHGAGPKPPQPPVPDDITVERAEPVGRYAVRIIFSDGHSTGLYSWSYLKELATKSTT